MESKILTNKNGIDIHITKLEGKKEELLEAFNECSEGRCTCPTQEYTKIETLNIVDSEDKIQLSIISRENEVIDTKEIEKCLEHTKNKVSRS
jgi:RNase adaptor protein for sRNA GlmZ degradation